MPELKAREGLIDFYFIEAQEPEAIQDLIVRLVKERIPARFGWTFRIGDRVIQTENDYNRDVFNGDLGVIEKINRIEQEMAVNFEGRQVEYDLGGPGRHEEGPGDGGAAAGYQQEIYGVESEVGGLGIGGALCTPKSNCQRHFPFGTNMSFSPSGT